jgi:hypothetical protein
MKLCFAICCTGLAHSVQSLKFLAHDVPEAPADTPVGSSAQDIKEMLRRFQIVSEEAAANMNYTMPNIPMNVSDDGMLPPLSANFSMGAASMDSDPAMAIAQGTGGRDYFTKMYTSENIADPQRGTGGCTAWRATLQCNPSGVRDTLQDKDCDQVIGAQQSGFCECGQYAQFAAVGCNHRPFTCETMCLKFAVISHKQAYYKGRALTPEQANSTIRYLMWANQTDLESMRTMTNELISYMNRAMQYTTASGELAKQSLAKFQEMMKAVRLNDATKAKAEMDKYRQQLQESPWLGIWHAGHDMVKAGRAIQATVKSTLPFEPTEALKLNRIA